MPYYVYAIHTDSNSNREYGVYEDFHEAEKCENDMNAARHPSDNYIVVMFYANDDSEVSERIRSIRADHDIIF
jgi:hypothetical protein